MENIDAGLARLAGIAVGFPVAATDRIVICGTDHRFDFAGTLTAAIVNVSCTVLRYVALAVTPAR